MLKSQFNAIVEWQQKTFPAATSYSKLKHLHKEIGELTTHHLLDIAAANGMSEATKHEYADCFFLLFGSAAANGMTYDDIIRAIEEKFLINQHRTWGQPDADGVVEHIKSEV